MFRHYLLFLHFLILPVAAYLVADMINLVIGNRLEASVKPLEREFPSVLSSPTSRRNYSDIIQGNIFNPVQRDEVEELPVLRIESTPAPAADLRVKLVGTVVRQDGISYAVIEHQMTREQQLYRLGDLIEGQAEIVSIDRDGVVLKMGGTQRHLWLYEEEGTTPGSAAMAKAIAPEGGFVKVTSNQWVLDREDISAALDNLPRLLTKARVVPNFAGGKPNGFRVFSIVPNSFFSKIGLQNGDVLQRINGIEIKDPENFMNIFQQLKGESSVTLDLVRNNQKHTFAYDIR
jgi:type II secretion system protein C